MRGITGVVDGQSCNCYDRGDSGVYHHLKQIATQLMLNTDTYTHGVYCGVTNRDNQPASLNRLQHGVNNHKTSAQ